jgi:hypothetical protein
MHIKKVDGGNKCIGFIAWCGEEVDGFTRSYLTIDNAMKAISERVGEYPCHKCLQEIGKAVGQFSVENIQAEAINDFAARVNARAERTIKSTHKAEGAHWNAMQVELKKISEAHRGGGDLERDEKSTIHLPVGQNPPKLPPNIDSKLIDSSQPQSTLISLGNIDISTQTDCRSEVGVTVSLIDSIITTCRVLAWFNLTPPAVVEALEDLRTDEDVARVFNR